MSKLGRTIDATMMPSRGTEMSNAVRYLGNHACSKSAAHLPAIEYFPVAASYTEWSRISATMRTDTARQRREIRLELPHLGTLRRMEPFFESHRSYVTGALVHEYVHFLQSCLDPEGFRRCAETQSRWRREWDGRRKPSPEECFENYYNDPYEQAAHGAQAAAEMHLDRITFEKTRLMDHIKTVLGGSPLRRDLKRAIRTRATAYLKAWI